MISLREDIRNHPINSVTTYTFQDLQDDFNTLNKGIDELIKIYEKQICDYSSFEYGKWLVTKEIIQDLKRLKGE